MRKLILCCLLVALTGCEDSEFRIPAFGAGSSGGGNTGCIPGWSCPKGYQPPPAQTYPPANQAPGTGVSKMLQDPESSEESTTEYIYAFTDEAAQSACQQIADRRGWRLDRVVAERFVNNAGKRKYSCFWTIFTPPSYDNDKHY